MTVAGGSDDATDDGSVSVVLVTGATMEGPGTRMWQNLLNYRTHMHLSLSNDL